MIGLAFMGVPDKCGFQRKVRTTDTPTYQNLMSGAIVPLILPDPHSELHQPLISKEDSYTLEILKKNAVY